MLFCVVLFAIGQEIQRVAYKANIVVLTLSSISKSTHLGGQCDTRRLKIAGCDGGWYVGQAYHPPLQPAISWLILK